MNLIAAIDFDGTLVRHRFPEIGEEVPYAFDWLKQLSDAGVLLILLTMRDDDRDGPRKFLTEAVDFCRSRGVTFWAHNTNPEQHTWTRSRKVYAHVYVDDAALGCPLVGDNRDAYADWSVIGPSLMGRHRQRLADFAGKAV